MATSLEHMLASGEGFPENGEFEDLVINGRAAKMRINLPSKTKISQWCQQTNTSFPVYEVKFFKQQDESYHMARVSIEGKTSYGKAEGKKMAENSAAFRFLNGDYLTEKNSFQSGLHGLFRHGISVKSSKKNNPTPSLKLKQLKRMTEFINMKKEKDMKKEEEKRAAAEENGTGTRREAVVTPSVGDRYVFFDGEFAAGPQDSEIIQLSVANCKVALNFFIVPEGGVDKKASSESHKIVKVGNRLKKSGHWLETVSLKEAAEKLHQFLRSLIDPVLICHGTDWVTLLNNLAQIGFDTKIVEAIAGVIDFYQVVQNDERLNEGSLSLTSLRPSQNLTEVILQGQISREEFMEKGHDASFDTEVLKRVFCNYVSGWCKVDELMSGYLLHSESLIGKAANIIERIADKRRRKQKVKSLHYKVFNGWSEDPQEIFWEGDSLL